MIEIILCRNWNMLKSGNIIKNLEILFEELLIIGFLNLMEIKYFLGNNG